MLTLSPKSETLNPNPKSSRSSTGASLNPNPHPSPNPYPGAKPSKAEIAHVHDPMDKYSGPLEP